MRVLVLWADDRSANLGVRVLGAGTEALARQVWPDAQFVFYNYGTGQAPIRLGSFREVSKELALRRHGLREWFSAFDIVLDTRAGDSFADIYGTSRLAAMSATAEVARRAGVPVVLTPQTIGPFASKTARALAQRSLRSAILVMARDTTSGAAAARLGRSADLITTDVVFALDIPEPVTSRDVVLNVSGLLWHPNPHVDAPTYRRVVEQVYDTLVLAGRSVSLLAHVLPSKQKDDDIPAVEQFARTHAPDVEILRPTSLTDVRQMLAGAALVVGSRMHACLNALSVGTPAVALAYSRKFAPLLSDLGWEHVIDLRSNSDSAHSQLASMIEQGNLDATVAAVTRQARDSLADAAELLRDRIATGVR